MKTYIKFLTVSFFKSFINIFLIMLSLVLILNIIKELNFLDKDVNTLYPIYLSIMNTPQ